MAALYPALLSLMLMALTLTSYHHYSSHERAPTSSLSKERGAKNLTVYVMAVGQGDGNIILCPNGRDIIIVDMGAVQQYKYTNRSYGAYLLTKFGALNKNIHIVITHPDEGHYSFLPVSFPKDGKLIKSIKEIVLGGSLEVYEDKRRFIPWLRDMSENFPVFTVNNGSECYGNDACGLTPVSAAATKKMLRKRPSEKDLWQFCGDDVRITVLGANICGTGRCSRTDRNERSIILKVEYKEWSLFMSGDFEGVNQQKKLMQHWNGAGLQSVLRSTYYKVANHGSWTDKKQANLDSLLKEVRPKRAYVSQAHPVMTYCMRYMHPKCKVFDGLINAGMDKIDSIATTPPVICWNDKFGWIEQRSGFAIYQTCRRYNTSSDKQICQDIVITTDGYSDHTTYVNVKSQYVFLKRPYRPGGKTCSVREWQKLKNQVSLLQPSLAAV